MREQAKQHDVVAFGAERPAAASAGPDQVLVVQIRNVELDLASAESNLGADFARLVPDVRVASRAVESIGGVRAVRAEVSASSETVIVYAVPVYARTAAVIFTCVPAECARVRQIAAMTVRAIQGLAEPTHRNLYEGPLFRSGAMLAIFAAMFLGLVAAEAGFCAAPSAELPACSRTA